MAMVLCSSLRNWAEIARQLSEGNFSAQQEAIQFPDRVAPNSGYARSQAQADSLATFWQIPGLKAFQVFEVPLWTNQFTETGNGSTLTGQVDGGANAITYFASGRSYPYIAGRYAEVGGSPRGILRTTSRRPASIPEFTTLHLNKPAYPDCTRCSLKAFEPQPPSRFIMPAILTSGHIC